MNATDSHLSTQSKGFDFLKFANVQLEPTRDGMLEMFGFERAMETDNQGGKTLDVMISWRTYSGPGDDSTRYQDYIPVEAYSEQFVLTYCQQYGIRLWETMILHLAHTLLHDFPRMDTVSIKAKIPGDSETPTRTASVVLQRENVRA